MTADYTDPSQPFDHSTWQRFYADAVNEIHVVAIHSRSDGGMSLNSAHEGCAFIAEELGELWADVKAGRHDAAIAEATRVGAMAARFIADMRIKRAAL